TDQGIAAPLLPAGNVGGGGGTGQRRAAPDGGVPAGTGGVLRQASGAVGAEVINEPAAQARDAARPCLRCGLGPRAKIMGELKETGGLQRHFGLLHAVALNVSLIVGAGVFITIPMMLDKLPGPYALLGWLAAGLLMVIDGLVWSELGAAFPGSGGSYL